MKKVILISLLIVSLAIFVLADSFIDNTKSEFDSGTYDQTFYNITNELIQLNISEGFTSGNYTSQVFDASATAQWNNISWTENIISNFNATLGSAIHLGVNRTDVFVKDEVYYLADMKDANKNFYLNFSYNLINNTILKIYAKKNIGVAVGIYSQSDPSGSNPLGTFTVTSTTGEWHNITLNINSPTNAIWLGEGTDSGTDPKEEFDYIFAEGDTGINLTFQARSDNDDSNWGYFTGPDGTISSYYTTPTGEDLNVSDNRYFQYYVNFTTQHSSFTPELYNVTIDYSQLSDTTSPIISNITETIIQTTATINWTTDESSNSSINYGLNQSLGSLIEKSSLLSSHSLELTSLSSGTLYYYNITSCDSSNNCITNGTFDFTTPSPSGGSPPGGSPSRGRRRSTSTQATEEAESTPVFNPPSFNEPKIEQEETNIQEETQPPQQIIETKQSYYQRLKKFISITGSSVLSTIPASSGTIVSVFILMLIALVGFYEEQKIVKNRRFSNEEIQTKKMVSKGKNIKEILKYANKMKWHPREVKLYYLIFASKKYLKRGYSNRAIEKIFVKGGFSTELITIAFQHINPKKKPRLISRLFTKKPKKTKKQVHEDLEKQGFTAKKSTKSSELINALQELKNIGNIDGSAAISREGLIIASNITKKTGAEKFSATSAVMVKSAETALNKLNKGKLNHIIINTNTRKVIATTAGNKAILVCLVKPRGKLGLMLLEIKKVANKISKILD